MSKAIDKFQAVFGHAPLGVVAKSSDAVVPKHGPVVIDDDSPEGKFGLIVEWKDETFTRPIVVMWLDASDFELPEVANAADEGK